MGTLGGSGGFDKNQGVMIGYAAEIPQNARHGIGIDEIRIDILILIPHKISPWQESTAARTSICQGNSRG